MAATETKRVDASWGKYAGVEQLRTLLERFAERGHAHCPRITFANLLVAVVNSHALASLCAMLRQMTRQLDRIELEVDGVL